MITAAEILHAIEYAPQKPEKERGYIGASEIGHPCARHLWLKFHRYVHPEKFDNRMLRLFKRGQNEEITFQAHLENLGFEVETSCSDQAGFREGFFAGHGDGIVSKDGVRYLAEYKTHSEKSFNNLFLKTLKESNPKHYYQMQTYMHKFDCKQGIYLAVCKNDDRLYCEIVEYDKEDAESRFALAEYIATTDKPPERICRNATDFNGKFCSSKDVCFGFEIPRAHCFNCTSAEKHRSTGKFGCDKIAKEGTIEQRIKNDPLPQEGFCSSHSFNPYAINELLKWEPVEFFPKQRAVKYKKPDGTEIINGEAPFGVESKDIKL